MKSYSCDPFNFFDDSFDFNYIEPAPKIKFSEDMKRTIEAIDKDLMVNPYQEGKYLEKVRKEILKQQHIDCTMRSHLYENNLRAVLFTWTTILAIIAFIGCQIAFRLFYIFLVFVSQIAYYKISLFFSVVSLGTKTIILFHLLKFVIVSLNNTRHQ